MLPAFTGFFRHAEIDGTGSGDGRSETWLSCQGQIAADHVAGGEEIYECDALVVGSGCAGLSAAVTAGHRGLNVLIVEKEPRFGGTTARSGGWLWIPGTSLARSWGIVESEEQARTYRGRSGCRSISST